MKSWEAAKKKLEAWGVFCHVFLGDTALQPATYEICRLMYETAYVRAILRAQMQRQPTLTLALLHLLQTQFIESFCQALEWRQRVRWSDFKQLRQDLATGNFWPESIVLPGAFTPQESITRFTQAEDHTTTPSPAPAVSPTQGDRQKNHNGPHNP